MPTIAHMKRIINITIMINNDGDNHDDGDGENVNDDDGDHVDEMRH